MTNNPTRRLRAGIRETAVDGLARGAGWLSRSLRLGGGSGIPGLVLERFDPSAIERRAAALPDGTVAVSGTNGKTTTSSMICAILREAGIAVASNETGSNMLRGIATGLLRAPSGARVGVFEVDEAWLPRVVPVIKPRLLVLTNVFRDQLDRFGEAESVARLLARAAALLPAGARIVANADDPLLWEALRPFDPVGFGVRPAENDTTRGTHRGDAEPETCPRCGASLVFSFRTLAHLGAARCSACDWAWSPPPFQAKISARSGMASVTMEIAGSTLLLPVGGIHNAYNAAAAIATAQVYGVPLARAVAALAAFRPSFGRWEELLVEGRPVRLVLAKNPAGASVVIRELAGEPDVGALVVAVSDQAADGRDISWIWDVDFERLAEARHRLIPGGRRASDVAVRLKYAGAIPEPSQREPLDAIRAALALSPPGQTPVVLATYTAMLDVRRALSKSRAQALTDGRR